MYNGSERTDWQCEIYFPKIQYLYIHNCIVTVIFSAYVLCKIYVLINLLLILFTCICIVLCRSCQCCLFKLQQLTLISEFLFSVASSLSQISSLPAAIQSAKSYLVILRADTVNYNIGQCEHRFLWIRVKQLHVNPWCGFVVMLWLEFCVHATNFRTVVSICIHRRCRPGNFKLMHYGMVLVCPCIFHAKNFPTKGCF